MLLLLLLCWPIIGQPERPSTSLKIHISTSVTHSPAMDLAFLFFFFFFWCNKVLHLKLPVPPEAAASWASVFPQWDWTLCCQTVTLALTQRGQRAPPRTDARRHDSFFGVKKARHKVSATRMQVECEESATITRNCISISTNGKEKIYNYK